MDQFHLHAKKAAGVELFTLDITVVDDEIRRVVATCPCGAAAVAMDGLSSAMNWARRHSAVAHRNQRVGTKADQLGLSETVDLVGGRVHARSRR